MHKILGPRATIESVAVTDNAQASDDIDAALRARGILEHNERLVRYAERTNFRRTGGESYGAVFTVTAMSDRLVRRNVYAKALVIGFGVLGSTLAVCSHVSRYHLLHRWGIRTPRLYGWGSGTIYQAWIAGHPCRPNGNVAVDELARIAATLDFRGARALNFLADLRIDLSGVPYYIDVGSDLGDIKDHLPTCTDYPSRQVLLRMFPEALEAYDTHANLLRNVPGGVT